MWWSGLAPSPACPDTSNYNGAAYSYRIYESERPTMLGERRPTGHVPLQIKPSF